MLAVAELSKRNRQVRLTPPNPLCLTPGRSERKEKLNADDAISATTSWRQKNRMQRVKRGGLKRVFIDDVLFNKLISDSESIVPSWKKQGKEI